MAGDVALLVGHDDGLVVAQLHRHRARERRDQRVSAVDAAVDDADADALCRGTRRSPTLA